MIISHYFNSTNWSIHNSSTDLFISKNNVRYEGIQVSESSSLISAFAASNSLTGQKSPMPPHNVSVIQLVLSMCVRRTHGFQGYTEIPDHGLFQSLTSAALRALLEVLLTYPGLATDGCEPLSSPSRDFLQGRKSGSADALARLFREGCTVLLRQRFPLFGPP